MYTIYKYATKFKSRVLVYWTQKYSIDRRRTIYLCCVLLCTHILLLFMYDDTQSHARIPIVLDSWQSINKCLAKCSHRRRIQQEFSTLGVKNGEFVGKKRTGKYGWDTMWVVCGCVREKKNTGVTFFKHKTGSKTWCKYRYVRMYLYIYMFIYAFIRESMLITALNLFFFALWSCYRRKLVAGN